jgi:hypothetical protein
MNSKQIAKRCSYLMQQSPIRFLGVFPRDMIPAPTYTPSCYVANIDTADEPGTHWIAVIHKSEGEVEFFDSLCQPPNVYGFMYRQPKTMNYRIQSLSSTTCGHHCILFLYRRANGISMQQFESRFDKENFYMNDYLAYDFVRRFTRKIPNSFSIACECPCNQTCINSAHYHIVPM